MIKVDGRDLSVVGSAEVEGNPTAIAAGRDAAWVANPSQGTVTRVSNDLRTMTIETGATPTDLVVGRRGVWVAAS